MSSHQPDGAVKNHPLGTQAAPVCEGGVLAPGRPFDVLGFVGAITLITNRELAARIWNNTEEWKAWSDAVLAERIRLLLHGRERIINEASSSQDPPMAPQG